MKILASLKAYFSIIFFSLGLSGCVDVNEPTEYPSYSGQYRLVDVRVTGQLSSENTSGLDWNEVQDRVQDADLASQILRDSARADHPHIPFDFLPPLSLDVYQHPVDPRNGRYDLSVLSSEKDLSGVLIWKREITPGCSLNTTNSPENRLRCASDEKVQLGYLYSMTIPFKIVKPFKWSTSSYFRDQDGYIVRSDNIYEAFSTLSATVSPGPQKLVDQYRQHCNTKYGQTPDEHCTSKWTQEPVRLEFLMRTGIEMHLPNQYYQNVNTTVIRLVYEREETWNLGNPTEPKNEFIEEQIGAKQEGLASIRQKIFGMPETGEDLKEMYLEALAEKKGSPQADESILDQ
jgi:hypothetical protein